MSFFMKYIVLVQYYTFHLNFSHQKVFTQPLKILFLRKISIFYNFYFKKSIFKNNRCLLQQRLFGSIIKQYIFFLLRKYRLRKSSILNTVSHLNNFISYIRYIYNPLIYIFFHHFSLYA